MKKSILLSFIILMNLSACSTERALPAGEYNAPPSTPVITVAPTPEPTIDVAAQKAYDEKNKANRIKAEAIVKAAEADKKKKLDSITVNLKKHFDEVQDITWYSDKTSPKYSNYNANFLYFAQNKDGKVNNMRLMIQYAGDDWVFIDKYIIKVDDETFEITPEYGEVKRDNDSGGVWEYYDTAVSTITLEIVKAIALSNKTIIRHQGDQHYFDRTVTLQEKKAITNILNAYEAMGGS